MSGMPEPAPQDIASTANAAIRALVKSGFMSEPRSPSP
jgi:hypothetical protein